MSRAQSAKRPVIGLLDGGERLAWWEAFRRQMHELGYVEGKTVRYEPRYAKGDLEKLPALAQELIRLNVAVIVVGSSEAARAARRATDKIPIVTGSVSDHVSLGLAASLARPGGNVTGLSSVVTDLTGKRLELLRELIPKLSRIAVIWHADNIGSSPGIRELEHVAANSKIALANLGVRQPGELESAFATAVREHAQAVFVPISPMTYAERRRIAALAIKHKIPTISTASELVEAGALLSFGTSYSDLFRRAAFYVDKILKGAKPGDLPIEQPTKFETVVNLSTAKALGIELSRNFLLRADRVID